MGPIGCAETSVTNHHQSCATSQKIEDLYSFVREVRFSSLGRCTSYIYMLRIFMFSLSLLVNGQSVLRLGNGSFLPYPSQLVILREMFDASVK